MFWATAFSFLVLLPISIPREISQLRFTSVLGVLGSVYLGLAVFFVYWFDRKFVPNPIERFGQASYFTIQLSGVTSSFPLIIFAYMYQVNIPTIYKELEKRQHNRMCKVVKYGTVSACILYIVIGVFGYLTFVGNSEVPPNVALRDRNILQAPYEDSLPINIGNFALFIAVAAASPLVVLPAKDTVEEIISGGRGGRMKAQLSPEANTMVTFLLIFLCYSLALFIPNIGDAMTIVGSTTNPAVSTSESFHDLTVNGQVGFILPIVFYWKTVEELPIWSPEKLTAIFVAVCIISTSVLGLVGFFVSDKAEDTS